MTLAQVGKYMPEGLRALSNLMNMLVEAAGACQVPVKKAADWKSIGLTLDKLRYWVGVNFSEPEKLWFGTRGGSIPKLRPNSVSENWARKAGCLAVTDGGEVSSWTPNPSTSFLAPKSAKCNGWRVTCASA